MNGNGIHLAGIDSFRSQLHFFARPTTCDCLLPTAAITVREAHFNEPTRKVAYCCGSHGFLAFLLMLTELGRGRFGIRPWDTGRRLSPFAAPACLSCPLFKIRSILSPACRSMAAFLGVV